MEPNDLNTFDGIGILSHRSFLHSLYNVPISCPSQGDDYWRMDNGNMEPGYPKSVASGFHGLTGTITAALPVPATRRRPESVYFFKKGKGELEDYHYLTYSQCLT